MSSPAQHLARIARAGRAERLLHVEEVPARSAHLAQWPDDLAPAVLSALLGEGVERPWSHQREAVDLARAGQHVVLATGTASGKSLGYLVPVLDAVLEGVERGGPRGPTALYLSPTKALAADQLARLDRLAVPGVRAATYDGDTPPDERRWVRQHANLVLTNPDLLHHSLLPGHDRWSRFLRDLRYVVVDECHVYRGVFGAHVAAVLRRLRRVAGRYGSSPTFVLASATVSEPALHASRLTGLPVRAVTTDGSPRGAMTFALWEPATGADGERRSATTEAGEILAELVAHGVQTVAFARSRAGAEALASGARRRLESLDPEAAGTVAAYRGGYLPQDRRELERGLRSGTLRGLAATNALELGIDISGLDAVVMAGWPGRRASLWQQAGRAGRSGADSLAVLVAADDPLDTYLVQHPDAIFRAPVESTVIDPDNPHVLAPHLAAAAAELPVVEADLELFGAGARRLLDVLVERGHPPPTTHRLVLGPGGPAGRAHLAARGERRRRGGRDAHGAGRRHRRRGLGPLAGAHRGRAPAPGRDVGGHRARPRGARGARRARRPGLVDPGAVGEPVRHPRDRAGQRARAGARLRSARCA